MLLINLKGFTQLLHCCFVNRGDEESLRFSTQMETQVNRIGGLINDLLDIFKRQTGKLTCREEPFFQNMRVLFLLVV